MATTCWTASSVCVSTENPIKRELKDDVSASIPCSIKLGVSTENPIKRELKVPGPQQYRKNKLSKVSTENPIKRELKAVSIQLNGVLKLIVEFQRKIPLKGN